MTADIGKNRELDEILKSRMLSSEILRQRLHVEQFELKDVQRIPLISVGGAVSGFFRRFSIHGLMLICIIESDLRETFKRFCPENMGIKIPSKD